MLSIDVSRFALYLIDSTRFYTNPGMNRLFLFFKQIYVPLLFIILEVVAINYYAQSTSYTRAKILKSRNAAISYGLSRLSPGTRSSRAGHISSNQEKWVSMNIVKITKIG